MWIDHHGSEVLGGPECYRLLALAAKEDGYGRLAVSREGAPVVVPVNFTWYDHQVLVRLSEGFLSSVVPGHLVAFEVDALPHGEGAAWSVLVRGLASQVDPADAVTTANGPRPAVPEPGGRLLAIRPDVTTGRRFAVQSS